MTAIGQSKKYLAAVDLGGSKILSVIGEADGRRLAEDRRATSAEEGPEVVLERIVVSLEKALAKAGLQRRDLAGVGICSPGPCDIEAGVVRGAPNLPDWRNVPICRYVEERLGVCTRLENDATAAALGEHVYGAGRGCHHLIYMTVSTGIGGGLIIDEKVYRGATGLAGEIGHMTIEPDGPRCGCGNRGCLEALASGTAIAARGRELVAQGGSALLARLAEEEGRVTGEMVCRAAEEGDGPSRDIIERAGHYLGIGLANLVNIFNPEIIVIGGGMAKAGELLLGPARAEMEARAFPQAVKAVQVKPAELGDYVGVMGMIALLREAVAT
ncbi:MAG: ROK family protein [Dehalococcoidia bacterium]